MNRKAIYIPDVIHGITFILYLLGSSLTLIEQGTELSLWIMTFAVVTSACTTLLPFLGVRWLKLDKRGSQFGRWAAWLIQALSLASFGYGMIQRLQRDQAGFQNWIMITTLLWGTWMLVFVYSRHAFHKQ